MVMFAATFEARMEEMSVVMLAGPTRLFRPAGLRLAMLMADCSTSLSGNTSSPIRWIRLAAQSLLIQTVSISTRSVRDQRRFQSCVMRIC